MRAARWIILGAALALTSCREPPGTEADPNVLARVGPHSVTVEEFKTHLARRGGLRSGREHADALLEEMIDLEVLHAQALRMGLDRSPEIQRAWRNLLIGKLRKEALAPRLENLRVEPEEIVDYYEANRPRYRRPARVRVAVLGRWIDPTTRQEARARLQRELAQARTEALERPPALETGFGTLAIDYSEHQATRYRGGDLGWLEAGRSHAWLSPEILEGAFALNEPGEISEVLAASDGFYLLRLIDLHETQVVPLADLEESIRHQLLREKREQIDKAFVAEARRSLRIRTYPERLDTAAEGLARPVTESRPPALP